MLFYQGRSRYIGIFNTLDDAVLANQIARDTLPKLEGVELPQEEIKLNIQRAKDAVAIALSGIGSNDEEDSRVDGEDSGKEQIDSIEPEKTPPLGVAKQGRKWVSLHA